MNENDDLLNFLVEGLFAPQRDLVTRAYYKFAEGDPNSGPVNEALLLTAYSRRLALAPKEMRDANADFRKLLAEGREMEARIRDRVELSNAGVVASFKDEATRAMSYLRASSQHNEEIVSEGRQIAGIMQKILVQGEALRTELLCIRAELKTHNDSFRKIAEATENTKANTQTIKEIVSNLTNMVKINWLTIGVGIGFVLTVIAMQLPWWGALLLFALAIGLLQLVAQAAGTSAREKAGTIKLIEPPQK
jgi:hypothetical protein